MLAKALVLAVSALTLATPPARATPASVDCGFDSVAHALVTGGPDTYTGVAYGYAMSYTPEEAVSVRCLLYVDGVVAASTDPGTGTNVAQTAGRVTFTATETQSVTLCAEWSAGSESGIRCPESTGEPFPPDEFWDFVGSLPGFVLDLLPPGDAGVAHCHFQDITRVNPAATGADDHTVAITRVTAAAPGDEATVRCYVRVDGVEMPNRVVVDAGNVAVWTVQYPPGRVEYCYEGPSGETCREVETAQVPPQEVIDLVVDVLELIDEP